VKSPPLASGNGPATFYIFVTTAFRSRDIKAAVIPPLHRFCAYRRVVPMRGKLLLIALVVLLAGSAFATNSPVPVYTFICNGTAFQRTGACPEGGRAGYITLGSDGNFYGAAQVSSEGSSTPNGGTVFSLTPAGTFSLLHTFLQVRIRPTRTATSRACSRRAPTARFTAPRSLAGSGAVMATAATAYCIASTRMDPAFKFFTNSAPGRTAPTAAQPSAA
jgi:uncharacterized repeat protein (TIGR03803 family)